MIVADTSVLITLTTAKTVETVFKEFDIHTTEAVIQELEETSEYDDIHGNAATNALNQKHQLTIHTTEDSEFESSRIDAGEASCITLTQELDTEFLITDDLRALPELQKLVDAKVAISPIVLKALVKRNVLTSEEAQERVEKLAEARDWLGQPIYRRAKQLFD